MGNYKGGRAKPRQSHEKGGYDLFLGCGAMKRAPVCRIQEKSKTVSWEVTGSLQFIHNFLFAGQCLLEIIDVVAMSFNLV